MPTSTIQGLLEVANSSNEGDTSLNLAKRVFTDESTCAKFFEITRLKLLNIEEWTKNSSPTDYELFDKSGELAHSEPISEGMFIRINLYGAGKYDWVHVVSITDEPGEFVITVRPSCDPTDRPVNPDSVSHFFSPEATNNFCVQKLEKAVVFYVIGLNEHQNTQFTDSIIESARNSAVANIGYYTGLQKGVWKEFCKNFLSTNEEKEG